MQAFKGIQYTFSCNFGSTRTGKTVTASILDSAGNAVVSGVTIGSVIELGSGNYAVTVTFASAMVGFIKWNNTTDSIALFEPIQVINDYRSEITIIRKIEQNRWKISSNQFIVYDDDGTTPYLTWDLLKNGIADSDAPNERTPA